MKPYIVRRTIVEIIYVDAESEEEAVRTCYDFSVADVELVKTTAKLDKQYMKEIAHLDPSKIRKPYSCHPS